MFLCKDCIENELTIVFLYSPTVPSSIYIIDKDSISNPDLRDSITMCKDPARGRVMQYVHDLIPYPIRFLCCV